MNLSINIEKTELAKKLEKELGLNFGLYQHYSNDAGYDVKACIEKPLQLWGGQRELISTGLHIEMSSPEWEIQVRPRSGLAFKYGITVLNTPGTIDYNYRQDIRVLLFNSEHYTPFTINPGDRIAQLCFRRVPNIDINYVEQINKTDRGGFGSSGK